MLNHAETSTGERPACRSAPYCAQSSMVLPLDERWKPICPFGTMPKRYSSPIVSPLSRPKKSPARSPKSPSPSGRPKRWVTRNALLNFGSRSEVGRLTKVKSGSAGFNTASSSSCAKAAAAHASARTTNTDCRTKCRITDAPVGKNGLPSIVRRADLNPAPNDLYLPAGQVGRAVERHPPPDDAGLSFQLVDDVAAVRIARHHPHQLRPLAAR